MPDQVLARDGPVAVPLDYPVPQSGELVPLMVRATLDGTSASGAFYAAVQVIAPSGRVMGTALSNAIAAGASADVTWFPGAELTEDGNAFGSFTTETLFLDTRSSSVSTVGSLETNAVYAISVQGTMNDWNLADNAGSPDADALFPTAGGAARVSTQVGIDPDTIFAYPSSHPQSLGHWTQFQMNLGSGWAHVEPDGGPFTTRQANNVYTYSVVGQGQPIRFRINDTPLADNYGYFKIVVFAGSTGGGGGGGGTVTSVTAADTSIVIGGTATDPTVRTATLDVIAADHPPAADWSNNSKKITAVTDPTNPQEAATKAYVDAHSGGGGTVTSVTAADTSIVIGGTATDPTVRTATLDVIAADHPPAADWSNNSKKITAVTDPTNPQEAATKAYVDAHSGGAAATIVTEFAAGVGQTWTANAATKAVSVVCVGSGGGGGGGASTGTVSRAGGSGGGGGSVAIAHFAIGDLTSPSTVNVAAGGGGGGVGATGTPGGQVSFGTFLSAFGGGGGGGSSGTGTGGAGGASAVAVGANGAAGSAGGGGAPASATAIGSQGANGGLSTNGTNSDYGGAGAGGGSTTGAGGNGGSSIYAGPGGAAGGGNTGTGVGGTAGTGGTVRSYTNAGGAGPNTNGSNFLGPYCGGGGGGGNGGGTAGVAHVGGNGGRGAGGGGGGTGGTGNSGGNGGDGRCIVIEHL